MPFHPCGSARLASPDVLRIDLDAGDTYVVPLARLAEVTRGSKRAAPLLRRYAEIAKATKGKTVVEIWVFPDDDGQVGVSEIVLKGGTGGTVVLGRDGADGFDAGELVQWLWERVCEPEGIMAILTPDGAIVFDEALIETLEGE